MMAAHDIGDRVRLEVTVKDYDDALTAATLTITVTDPDGNATEVEAEAESTGLYYGYVTVDQAGTWRWRAETSGALVGAAEGAFTVRKSYFA